MNACAVASAGSSKVTALSGMQLDEIRRCHTGHRGVLDAVFEKFELSSMADRCEALLKVMGIKEGDSVFYSGSAEAEDDCGNVEQDQYEAVVGAFFSGFWVHNAV